MMPTMQRLLWCVAATGAVACGDGSGPAQSPRLLVKPVLDSAFVGDTGTSHTVIYLNSAGDTTTPGPIRWSSLTPAVFTVDSLTGKTTAVGHGIAILVGTANGVSGRALVVVSDTLEVSAQLDTIYLLPLDTMTIPVTVLRRGAVPPAATFGPTSNGAIYTIDTVTGLVTAGSPGGARYVTHVGTLADTGAIVVRQADTTPANSRSFLTVSGTANRRIGGLAFAINYSRHSGATGFQARAYSTSGNSLVDNVLLTALAPVASAATFPLDSISPTEAFGSGADPVCQPPRAWASWTTFSVSPSVTGLSRHSGGLLAITKVVSAPGGTAVGGRFRFLARRTDLYGDSLGTVAVLGTFVAPLHANLTACP